MGQNSSHKRKRAAGDGSSSSSTRPSKRPTPTHTPQPPQQSNNAIRPPPPSARPSTKESAAQVPVPAPAPTKEPKASASGPPKTTAPRPSTSLGPHAAILAILEGATTTTTSSDSSKKKKYAVLAPFVLSSTKIRARVTAVVAHLQQPSGEEDGALPPDGGMELPVAVAMLHSRAGDACKMITIAEQVKRIAGKGGRAWWQYNETFEPEARVKTVVVGKKNVGGEEEVAVLSEQQQEKEDGEGHEDEDEDDEEEDGFEVMRRGPQGADTATTGATTTGTTTRFEDAVNPKRMERKERSLRIFLALAPVPELACRASVTVQTNSKEGVAR